MWFAWGRPTNIVGAGADLVQTHRRAANVRYMYQLRFMSGDGTAPVKEGLA